jgi:transposase
MYYAGLDWANASHTICVVGEQGNIVTRFEVAHDADGLAELQRRLARYHGLSIAIERPTGLLVDALVEAGFTVVPIHPNVVKAARPRYSAAGGKSDASDAYLLADLLRTDGHRFRPLTPQSDRIRALRALVRARDDLVGQRVALANQLRSTLEEFWPGAARIFADIDSPIALAFVRRYPTPQSAARLAEKRLASFLAQEHYCRRRSPTELLERLRSAPAVTVSAIEADAKADIVMALVDVLERLVARIAALTVRIEHDIAQIPEGRVMMSFPRAGRINAAQIVAELGDVRERFPTFEQLAAEAGVCPVTYQSGKHRGVAFRWACNTRLRVAITCWADNSRHESAWAAALYARARSRGHDHPHAVRILARAWVRVLWRAWCEGAVYDPAAHGAACALIAA